jgi:ABC-type multidrug transport system fused ATPase/permease subunit
MGMHTIITECMCTLSSGQQKRLMVARALIRQPRFLFFDEATSALDNEAQRIVTESTRTLNATRVVIAHRLSTVMHADKVIVPADGGLVEQGRPTDLLNASDGLFHRLVRRQIQ